MALSRRFPVALLAAALTMVGVPTLRAAAQATGTIRGTVVDSSTQRGVPSAQVIVVGTRRGAVTNDAGAFTLSGVPAGAVTVRVSRIGYEPSSRAVSVSENDVVTTSFVLKPAIAMLSTVVSVGYGTASRQNVTSAIASVDGGGDRATRRWPASTTRCRAASPACR